MEFSADLIDERIWLGSIAAMENTLALEKLHITHIISVIDANLSIDKNIGIIHKHIRVEDVETTDLLIYFDECYDFIDKALSNNPDNNVLIHCLAGVSRSSTIACMWLMRRYHLSASVALKRLRVARPIIQPNLSFVCQLYLFEQMNHQFDINHNLYKEFQFERARTAYIDHDTELYGIDEKNHLRQQFRKAFTLPHGHASCTIIDSYLCRQCQTELFTNADLSYHSEGRGIHDWFIKYGRQKIIESSSEIECHQKLFTNYLEWIMNQIDTPENMHSNDIKCRECSINVGNYYLNGTKCSCGRWITPAFLFNTDKIEKTARTKLNITTEIIT